MMAPSTSSSVAPSRGFMRIVLTIMGRMIIKTGDFKNLDANCLCRSATSKNALQVNYIGC